MNSGNVIWATNANWMASPTGLVARFRSYGDQLTVTLPNMNFFVGGGNTNGDPTPVTIDFWIYPRGYKVAPSGYAFIVSLAQDSYSTWSLEYANNGQTPLAPIIAVDDNDSTPLLSSQGWSQYLTENTWHSVRIVVPIS